MFSRDPKGSAFWPATLFLLALASTGAASDLDEFRVKREAVFEFAERPTVTKRGDRIEIRFETKGFCDVTIAIEEAVPEGVRNPPRVPDTLSNSLLSGTKGDRHLATARSQSPLSGRIIRHLASGVLGPNAPAPFQRDSKKQTIVWDGKDDQDRYVDNKDDLTIRVSLGLKPMFERTLFWSPKKRYRQGTARWGFVGTQAGLPTPRIAAAPEGVYVFEGRGVDHLRLFDHDGNYVRTIYPPPPGKLGQIVDLALHTFPQDGRPLPLKHDILQTTFLTSGPSGMVDKVGSMFGTAATALATWARRPKGRLTRLALVHRRLNRLASDGSSDGLPLTGPATDFGVVLRLDGIPDRNWRVSPISAAFSPDGKWLYCTGYLYRQGRHTIRIEKDCLHGVIRLNYETNDPAEVFAGSMKMHDSDTANGRFRDATSVDCDSNGRVYVADYMNDRIQVFSPDGTHLKNIPVFKPALIRIHRRTNEIYVFSWMYDHWATMGADAHAGKRIEVPARLTRLGPYDAPKPRAAYPLPLLDYRGVYSGGRVWAGVEYTAEIDSWTDPVTIWLVPGHPGRQGVVSRDRTSWQEAGIKLLAERDGKLELIHDFGKAAAAAVTRLMPPMFARQRLYVNPKTGLLYVAEGQTTHYKAVKDVLEIDPATGAIREVSLPFDAEDLAFDADGHIYLKSHDLLVRYDMNGWKEIPFGYGEDRWRVGCSSSRDGRRTDVSGGMVLYNGTGWHKGGVYVSPRGDILTSSYVTKGDVVPELPVRTDERHVGLGLRSNYIPVLYPGRVRFGEVHVWEPQGRVIHEDAVKGLMDLYGVGLDRDRNVYLMASSTRILDGKRYFNRLSGTLMKFKPGRGRVISQNSRLIPIEVTGKPAGDRPHDIVKGSTTAWVVGAEWMYGGVGYSGKNAARVGGHCACYNSRFALDYFARSFAPEVRRFCVAVLDTNGNLILRLGQYGNADCNGPGSLNPLGGDEIGLMHGAYVATHTDRRVFIADPGNARIVSVKLDYHTTERVALTEVEESG